MQKCPLAHPWSCHTLYPFMPTASLFTLCWVITNSPDTQVISIYHSCPLPEHNKQSQKKAKTSGKKNQRKMHNRNQDMLLSFHCGCNQVNSFLLRMNPEDVSSFICFLICPNISLLPTLGKPFSATAIPSQQGGRLHTRLTATFSQLHELQSVSCWISALPLPIQLKHKKQYQKKSTMNSELTLPSAQPMTSPSVPPATKQLSTCCRKRPEAKQPYHSGRELQRTRSSPPSASGPWNTEEFVQ